MAAKVAPVMPSDPFEELARWRSPASLRAFASPTQIGLEVRSLPASSRINAATCVTAISDGLVAIGSSVSGPSAIAIAGGEVGDLKVYKRLRCPESVYDLTFSHGVLAAACSNGAAYVYGASACNVAASTGDAALITLSMPSCRDAASQTPSSRLGMQPATHITAVRLSPVEPTVLLALENERLHVWDTSQPGQPLCSESASTGFLYAATWHSSGQEFYTGGHSGTLKLFDRRLLGKPGQKATVWKHRAAHGGAIRALHCSPFVPHWLASGGDDALIRIWDMRYDAGAVLTIPAHESTVTSLSWSRSHADHLASGSADSTVHLHCLRLPPHYRAASAVLSPPAGVVGVTHPSSRPLCVAVAADGAVSALEMSAVYLAPLAPQRWTAESLRPAPSASAAPRAADAGGGDAGAGGASAAAATSDSDESEGRAERDAEGMPATPSHATAAGRPASAQHAAPPLLSPDKLSELTADVRAAEIAVYARDYATGMAKAVEAAELLAKADCAEAALAVLSICAGGGGAGAATAAGATATAAAPQLSRSSSLSPAQQQQEAQRAFRTLLDQVSYGLPPTASGVDSSLPTALLTRLRMLRLKLSLASAVHSGDAGAVLDLTDDIVATAAADPESLDLTLLAHGLAAVLGEDYVAGVSLCVRLAEALQKQSRFELARPLVELILEPTIYDVDPQRQRADPTAVQKADDIKAALFGSPRDTLAQLALAYEAMLSPQGAEALVAVLADQRKVYSAALYRVYLNALLSLERYDAFFIAATAVRNTIEGSDFAQVVDAMMLTVALPRCQQYLQECAEFDAATPWDASRSRAGVLMLVNLFQNATFLPPAAASVLPPLLAQLVAELEAALREAAASPTEAGYDAKQEAQSILEALSAVREGRTCRTGLDADIQQTVRMLKGLLMEL